MNYETWTDHGLVKSDIRFLLEEDERQLKKWGIQQHSQHVWMTILTEEVGELAKAILHCGYSHLTQEEVRKEAIQVATLALKIAKMSMEE